MKGRPAVSRERLTLAIMGGAAVVAFVGAARAQAGPTGSVSKPPSGAHPAVAPPTPAPAAAPAVPSPASAPPGVSSDAATPDAKPKHHQLVASASGTILFAGDGHQPGRERARFGVGLAYRPAGAAIGLEIAATYTDALGTWQYTLKTPDLTGTRAAQASTFEQDHRIDLLVRYDVLRRATKGGPVQLSPFVDVTYLGADSPIYKSMLVGGGGGLAFGVDLGTRTTIDASFGVVRGFFSNGGENVLLGPVKGAWNWGGGVSLGATDWSRIRLGYVGEALDQGFATRLSHGAELGFRLSFL